MRVLVTGAGALVGQGIIRSLRQASSAYHVIAVDPDPRAVGLHWADRSYVVPVVRASSYLDRITEILTRERPDAVLIGTDVELMTFAEHQAPLETTYDTRIIVSPPRVVQIADDKWLTARFLAEQGLPFPRSEDARNAASLIAECGFPLIVKPRTGARSVGVQVVSNERDLALALEHLPNAVVQQYIADATMEFTSGVVVTDGVARAVITMRRDLRDGNTYRAYVEPDSPYDAFLADCAERLGAVGPVNFQFRLNAGEPTIFEINARFSGTTPLRACAGFNEVDAVVRHAVQADPIERPRLRRLAIFRYLDEIAIDPAQLTLLDTTGELDAPQHERVITG